MTPQLRLLSTIASLTVLSAAPATVLVSAPTAFAAESGITLAASSEISTDNSMGTSLTVAASSPGRGSPASSLLTPSSAAEQGGSATGIGASRSQLTARSVIAKASIVNGIVVSGAGGRPVSLTGPGIAPRTKRASGNRPVTFTGLTPGKRYTAWVAGRAPITVTAVNRVADATGLIVKATDSPTAVRLNWRHQRTLATGGASIGYRVMATPVQAKSGSPKATAMTVIGSSSVVLRGLNPDVAYLFTVTPRNSASIGRTITARMSASLASLLGIGQQGAPTAAGGSVVQSSLASSAPTLSAANSASELRAPLAPTSPAASSPASSAPAMPLTRTIWVCPDGFTDAGPDCITARDYTFTTRTYTFTSTQVGMHEEWIVLNGVAWSTHLVPTYADIKDPTPAGFTDDGTQWVKRDDTPEGYVDDGTHWVRHEAKVSRVVPA